VVSHDRDFLQGLTDKVFEFRDGSVKQHIGDIYDFLEKRRLATLDQLNLQRQLNARSGEGENNASAQKQQYEKKKLLEKELRKITGRIEKSETEIHRLETGIAALDACLANPDKHMAAIADGSIYKQYEQLKAQLKAEMDNWELLHLELEEARSSQASAE
jgi:ATP-binding cassette subfamily F protein 3